MVAASLSSSDEDESVLRVLRSDFRRLLSFENIMVLLSVSSSVVVEL